MKLSIVALVALLCLFAMPTAMAQIHIAPSTLVIACKSDQEKERTKCATFLRGVAERLQTHLEAGKTACRQKPFTDDDVTAFNQFAPSNIIPDTGEAFALALHFWASDLSNVPCAGVPGTWSMGHLLSLCEIDNSGPSLCKVYSSGVMGIADVEQAISKTPYFCVKGDQIRSDAEILEKFKSWMADDPRRADEPAASGYIEMLKASYPC